MANDWITHNGQGAPDLPPGTRVQVRFRDGDVLECEWDAYHASDPEDSNWHHGEPWPYLDIIAYRVVDEH